MHTWYVNVYSYICKYVRDMETGFQFCFSSMRVFASKLSESGCIYTLRKEKRLNGIEQGVTKWTVKYHALCKQKLVL